MKVGDFSVMHGVKCNLVFSRRFVIFLFFEINNFINYISNYRTS